MVDVVYTGNHGRDLLTIDPTINGFGFAGLAMATPDPRFSTMRELTNGGISNYNGLTVALRRALSHGLKGEISYTWSHSLDDNSGLEPYNATATIIRWGCSLRLTGPTAITATPTSISAITCRRMFFGKCRLNHRTDFSRMWRAVGRSAADLPCIPECRSVRTISFRRSV